MTQPTVATLLSRAGADPAGVAADRLRVEPTGIFHDSRAVEPGGVFVAIRGARFDGAAFADDAVARGAVLVVAEHVPSGRAGSWVAVPDARAALAALASAFHGDPSHDLQVVGVTGTNGKTTTTYLIESMLQRAGVETGRLSSIANRVAADQPEEPAVRTTAEATGVQAWLASMRDRGTRACVMEVSSHALALRRVDHVRFAAGVFTNLTRDHLDFHGDMERYFRAKAGLFARLAPGAPAVVNVDDARGRELANTVARPVTYALDRPADVRPSRLELTLDRTRMEVRTPRGTLHLESMLIGRVAAYNVLAAAAAAVALDVPFRGIEEGVRAMPRVPGRLQAVTGPGDDVTVIVDFAHTDDALRGLLEAIRPLARREIVTVFGCGGDRDVSKRPLMGAVAARMSHRVVLTSDNPRSEAPLDIIADIRRGLETSPTPWMAVPDRAEAIGRAIQDAKPGDVVVIAGKGDERQQIVGTRALPFDDRVVARAALSRRRAGARVG